MARSQKPQPPWFNSYDLTRSYYKNWFNRFFNIAISRFKWEGLEEHPFINERFIEQFLFFEPLMVGFSDPMMGPVVLPAMQESNFNIIGDPLSVRAYGYNSNYNRSGLDESNSAYLWTNMSRFPDVHIIRQFAKRLTEIDRTIDLNLAAQKTPRIAFATEDTKLSVQNLTYQVDKYDPWLYIKSKNLNADDLKNMIGVLDLRVEYLGLQLEAQKKETLAEALTYLGVESNYNMKAERQFTTEVTMTLGQIEADRYSPLVARQDFCEKFNKMFGTHISCSPRSELALSKIMAGEEDVLNPEDKTKAEHPEKEGEDNE